ncbi:GH36-type glycosyl hydrolase domain-containing protein [Intrasporangium sp. YIM S08009]|uniref:GH36-type glycosyl hydrolase domain-containing protein n=1 Tax=Intrasporangium zincisolvens TaxID=3080018 RepID=UPI002B056B3A|nr:cellobiose phosphorylase [Intrasporangium sp. YIM S08009]
MLDDNAVLSALPARTLSSAAGLTAEVLDDGALRRLEAFGLSLLLHPASVSEAGLANVHLRVHRPDCVSRLPLLGPDASGPDAGSRTVSLGADGTDGTVVEGVHEGVAYRLTLTLGREHPSWHWRLTTRNTTDAAVRVDAVLTHDPALAPLGAVRTNEYYVAQYLDVSPVAVDGHGTALAVRQNMPGPRVPWLLVGTTGRGTGWATDALQLVERRADGVRWPGLDAPELPGVRHQHEHTLAALQDEAVHLAPGASHTTGFWGIVVEDHPEGTSDADAEWARLALADGPDASGTSAHVDADASGDGGTPAHSTLWSSAPGFPSHPLTGGELDALGLTQDRRHVEMIDGDEVAWQLPDGQLVTAAKDLAVLRPHGQLLRTGDALTPDTRTLTSTVWMAGTFHSQLTRGHAGRQTAVTGRRTYLGLLRASGLRLFADDGAGGWQLLETPSAWKVGLDHATWWYADASGRRIAVTSTAPADEHRLGLTVGQSGDAAPRRLLLAVQVADDLTDAPAITLHDTGAEVTPAGSPRAWHLSWTGRGDAEAGDARLQSDGRTRSEGWLTVLLEPAAAVDVTITAGDASDATSDASHEVRPSDAPLGAGFWDATAHAVTLDTDHHTGTDASTATQVGNLAAALPWFTHDAFVHYLSPRGLEQFSGGAWGTRDVCQGPVGLLTALDRQDAVRDVLLMVFRAQNERGDWPQAFEFLPPLPESGQHDSHGDVVFWPVLAAGDYLRTTGDGSLLDELVPFVGDDALAAPLPVAEHLAAAVRRIAESTVPSSPLPAYGHGDWNDSLQPADPRLAAKMVSTWTAVLQTQALRTLAEGLRAAGGAGSTGRLADECDTLADATHAALSAQLDADPVLPGYLLQQDAGGFEPLVHPTDTMTGLKYGILPWIHAISAELLTPEQARHHLDLIGEHLLGPDGARLFDRPVRYAGGPMSVFQRAEASTFWGREIGLMYMHAHLRYAEALARVGDGAALLEALAKASPVGLDSLVPQARPRQTSCYYSSSDGAFTDRYDAQDRYAALMAGDVPLEGGWRVYSSGPGLVLRLVTEVLLGVRRRGTDVEIDPVLPPGSGELVATVPLAGHGVRLTLTAGEEGHGVRRVTVGGRDVSTRELTNPYRRGGVAVALTDLVPTPDAPSAASAPDTSDASHVSDASGTPTLEISVETY